MNRLTWGILKPSSTRGNPLKALYLHQSTCQVLMAICRKPCCGRCCKSIKQPPACPVRLGKPKPGWQRQVSACVASGVQSSRLLGSSATCWTCMSTRPHSSPAVRQYRAGGKRGSLHTDARCRMVHRRDGQCSRCQKISVSAFSCAWPSSNRYAKHSNTRKSPTATRSGAPKHGLPTLPTLNEHCLASLFPYQCHLTHERVCRGCIPVNFRVGCYCSRSVRR